ncbi:MAG: hypothetical protein DWQ01_21230 [Planctomycetota bacterium]|nr:MAG: hypothetical protein DWQ01_21230 [Planctomycetota bacterium]
MKLFSLAALVGAALILAPAASAQYTLDIDPGASSFTWSANAAAVGTVQECGTGNTVGSFQVDGTMSVALDPHNGALSCGKLYGSQGFTIPTLLCGRIPNPIPFLPDLARIEIDGAVMDAQTAPFDIDAVGDFTTMAVLGFTAGVVTIDPFVGETTVIPLAGLQGEPTPIDGNIVDNAGTIEGSVPVDIVIDTPDMFFSLAGTLVGSAPAIANFSLNVGALTAGTDGTFDVSGADANAVCHLAYSTTGAGCTAVDFLNTVVSLNAPVLVGATITTDAAGSGSWTLPIPAGTTGVTVSFQASHLDRTSNVVTTTIL